MYRYPERPLRVEEFECQLPPEARAELGTKQRVVPPPRKPEPSPPVVRQAAPQPAAAISFASPPQAKPTATPWFIGMLLAIILIGMVTMTLNHSGGAGNLAWAACTGSRADGNRGQSARHSPAGTATRPAGGPAGVTY